MDRPIKHINPTEVKYAVDKLNNTKSPGYDNIDSKVLTSFPINHFPLQWRFAKNSYDIETQQT